MTGADADVAVVGYGPVGMTLAILVAQRGHSVVVAERQPASYLLPRAVHFDHEVARILQSAGLGSALPGMTEPVDEYEWRNGEGTTLLRLGRAGASASGWPESLMFHQPSLEALLDRRARSLGVDVRRGLDVTGLTWDPDCVTLSGANGETVRARYAVGCDGANSTVRKLAGLPVQDLGFFYDWLIVDVTLHEPRVFQPVNVQICDPARPTTVVSGGPGQRRWEFMRLEHETLEGLNSAARAWELLEPWGVRPGNATLVRHAVYTFNARYAEQWRAGRVLLAGDAAHQMPPFAGQGLCAGIRDAANLAWKLDLILTGGAPDQLLDTYDTERLPSARQAIELSMELGKVICVPDPAEAAERDKAMSILVGPEPAEVPPLPGIQTGIIDACSPHAGKLFVQGNVAGGGLFDDVHGAGWRLVTVDSERVALDPETSRWFASIGGRLVAVPADDPVYCRWFTHHNCTAALQRPDFHLFGTAAGPADAAGLLNRLRTRLSSTVTPEGSASEAR
ncbi:MAG TPA: bifunctional 3-(3-hydroxy-phenyl)propionate/3-hydroxycinnamic acid hydroxylase [Streptosporangiaceae bacterium]